MPSTSRSNGSSEIRMRRRNVPSSAIARNPFRSSLMTLRVVFASIATSPFMIKSTSRFVRVRQYEISLSFRDELMYDDSSCIIQLSKAWPYSGVPRTRGFRL